MKLEFDIQNGGKTLIVSNVVTLLLAVVSIIWSAAQMDQTLQQIQDNQERFRARLTNIETYQAEFGNRLTHLETNQSAVVLDVSRLETFHLGGEFDEPTGDRDGSSRFDPGRQPPEATDRQRRGTRDTTAAGPS